VYSTVFHDERFRDRSWPFPLSGIIEDDGGQIEVKSELAKAMPFIFLAAGAF